MDNLVSVPVGTMDRFPERAERTETSSNSSAVSWAAVGAGAFATAALQLSLMALGAGIGLSALSPWPTMASSAQRLAGGAIVWIILVQALSCALGGYLAGRLRTKWVSVHTHEVYFRDTAHGFLAWAVGLVISVFFLSSVGLTTAKDASIVGAQGAGDYYVDSLLRGETPSTESTRAAVRDEAKVIFATALQGPDIAPRDRSYLADLVAARTGLDRARAEARVDETLAGARQTLEKTRKSLAHSLYWLFAALVTGAFFGSFAATIGGRQRDFVYAGAKPAGRI